MWALGAREHASSAVPDGVNTPSIKVLAMMVYPSSEFNFAVIKLKSLILAQIERWRHALHMQVERQRGGNPGGERRTGE